jgi:ribosome-associated toxin RatA of RatAB toxin-antitoxin module
MAKVTKEHLFTGTQTACFKALTNYERYPEYIPGVLKVEIVPSQDPEAAVCLKYELNIVKTFFYILEMYHKEGEEIRWKLVDSNLMKVNDGKWALSSGGKGKTKAQYSLDVEFKGFVPSMIVKKVTESSLPAMFEGFQKLIDAKL